MSRSSHSHKRSTEMSEMAEGVAHKKAKLGQSQSQSGMKEKQSHNCVHPEQQPTTLLPPPTRQRQPRTLIEQLPSAVLSRLILPYLTHNEVFALVWSSAPLMQLLHPDYSSAPYQLPSPSFNAIWCLKIVIFVPSDIGDGGTTVIVKHFDSYEEAEEALNKKKLALINEWRDELKRREDGYPLPKFKNDPRHRDQSPSGRFEREFRFWKELYYEDYGSHEWQQFKSRIFQAVTEQEKQLRRRNARQSRDDDHASDDEENSEGENSSDESSSSDDDEEEEEDEEDSATQSDEE